MESLNDNNNNNEVNPLVYLLAGSNLENRFLRICLEDIGIKKLVSMVNIEHLKQELFHQPDIVMIDSELNNPIIPDLIQEIKAHNPKIHIVFLINHEDHMEIINLLKFGAFDFAVKDMHFSQKLTRIVNTVASIKQNTN